MHYTETITRCATLDDKVISITIDAVIHPSSNGIILVHYPGFRETPDGPDSRYLQAATILQKSIGAVVRLNNHDHAALTYAQSCQDDLRAALQYTTRHALSICDSSKPTIYLMGYSAGASAAAAVAHEFSEIKRLLLIAPTGDAGREAVTRGLSHYKGELYIAQANEDRLIPPHKRNVFFDLATQTNSKDVISIPYCDHNFHGEENSALWPAIAEWAFLGK